MEFLVIRWSHTSTGQFFRTQDFVSPATSGGNFHPLFRFDLSQIDCFSGVLNTDFYHSQNLILPTFLSIQVEEKMAALTPANFSTAFFFSSLTSRRRSLFTNCRMPIIPSAIEMALRITRSGRPIYRVLLLATMTLGKKHAQEDDDEIGGWI